MTPQTPAPMKTNLANLMASTHAIEDLDAALRACE
jgi:hypothetical protein